ncbi:hypothetical protein, partial [Sphingomonas bacterium]|uniref:hypothetical protein n=1 Tax=Sphingomonas bacterium TaxID=1895847 RepID=UPI001C2D0F9A
MALLLVREQKRAEAKIAPLPARGEGLGPINREEAPGHTPHPNPSPEGEGLAWNGQRTAEAPPGRPR